MAREVDPISSTAFLLYSVATAIIIGLLAPITLMPDTLAQTVGQDLALAGAVGSLAVGITYNGVDLGQLNGVEIVIVLVGVVAVIAREYVPRFSDIVSQTDPYGSVLLWVLGGVVYLILSFGKGVDWYPIGGGD